jgi:hypothetical protein
MGGVITFDDLVWNSHECADCLVHLQRLLVKKQQKALVTGMTIYQRRGRQRREKREQDIPSNTPLHDNTL